MRISSLPLAVSVLIAVSAYALAQTPAPKLLFSEDFENVPVGEIPKGSHPTSGPKPSP
jgi:hypothetical protein